MTGTGALKGSEQEDRPEAQIHHADAACLAFAGLQRDLITLSDTSHCLLNFGLLTFLKPSTTQITEWSASVTSRAFCLLR